MSTRLSAGRVRAIYDFIKTHRDEYSVRTMCRLLDVAPSGYYAWLKEPLSTHAQEDARLLRLIRGAFVASQGIYGAPRIFLDLRESGKPVASTASRGSCERTTFEPFTAIARDAGRWASLPC